MTIPRTLINVERWPGRDPQQKDATRPQIYGQADAPFTGRAWRLPGKTSFLEPSQWALPRQRFNTGNKAVKRLVIRSNIRGFFLLFFLALGAMTPAAL